MHLLSLVSTKCTCTIHVVAHLNIHAPFQATAAILDFENITIQELQLHMYPNHECCLKKLGDHLSTTPVNHIRSS
jgi:hypothetical protein